MTSPLTDVRGGFTGKCIGEIAGRSHRPWGALSTACQGRASGAPPPGGGCASLRNAPLDEAFSQIHRRGLGAPGPAQGCPLWRHAPRWTRRTWAIHPAALSRLGRGVASRDQPLERLRFAPPPAAGCGLAPGVGHGSLPCAATAQQTKQKVVAGAPPLFGSAWGPTRWFSGRPAHCLGPVVPGSFPSHLAMHGNRTGSRFAGAHLTA